MVEKVLGIEGEDAKEVEQLLESFSCSILCHSCWRKFLYVENRPELAKRFWKWFNGKYSNNPQAIQRITKRIEKEVYQKDKLVPVISVEELPELLADYYDWLNENRGKTVPLEKGEENLKQRIRDARLFLRKREQAKRRL